MAVETEIKLRIEDPAGLRENLARMSARLVRPRHLEDNFVLDFSDGRLCSLGSLVRIRTTAQTASITFKGPASPCGLYKVREELESPVQDGAAVLKILAKLGLRVWFRYQKYREEHAIVVAGHSGEVQVAYDETPIGNFVELEGTEEGIRKAAEELGFAEREFLRDSYYHLYVLFCRGRGEVPTNMVFA